MATTPNQNLPLIDSTMTADVPRDMNALAQAVDSAITAHETATVLDHPDGSVTDAKIGNRTIDDSVAAAAGADTPTRLWSKLANMIKAITGKGNWWTLPATSIESLNGKIDQDVRTSASPTFQGVNLITPTNDSLIQRRTNWDSGDKFKQSVSGTNTAPNLYWLFNDNSAGTEKTLLSMDGLTGKVSTAFNTLDNGGGQMIVKDTAVVGSGGSALELKPGINDHVYISFFPRSASSTTRGAYFGFGAAGSTQIEMRNELDGGQVVISTNNGNVVIKSPTYVEGAIIARGIGLDALGSGANQLSRPLHFYYTDASGVMHTNTYLQADKNGDLLYIEDGAVSTVLNTANHNSNGDPHTQYVRKSSYIGENWDLNDMQSEGFYYCPANAVAQTVKNMPPEVAGAAFFLSIHPHAGCVQTLTTFLPGGQRIFTRNNYNGTWGGWLEYLTKTNGSSKLASISEYLVQAANTSYYPINFNPAPGNYDVKVYARVTTATTVTIQVAYSDGSGNQVATIVDGPLAPGSYTFIPQFINATSAINLVLGLRSSVANAVYVSAAVMGV